MQKLFKVHYPKPNLEIAKLEVCPVKPNFEPLKLPQKTECRTSNLVCSMPSYAFRNNQRDENSEFTFFKDTNYTLGDKVVDIPTEMNNMK